VAGLLIPIGRQQKGGGRGNKSILRENTSGKGKSKWAHLKREKKTAQTGEKRPLSIPPEIAAVSTHVGVMAGGKGQTRIERKTDTAEKR